MKYYCENCDNDVDDKGPYERPDGEYHCQDCQERAEAMYEAQKDDVEPGGMPNNEIGG